MSMKMSAEKLDVLRWEFRVNFNKKRMPDFSLCDYTGILDNSYLFWVWNCVSKVDLCLKLVADVNKTNSKE